MHKPFNFAAVALTLFLSACLSSTPTTLLTEKTQTAHSAEIAGEHQIFVATTRGKSEDRLQVYAGTRSPELHFAKVDMTVPKIHQTGQIERRSGKVADASKYFTAKSVTGYSEASFEKALRADIKRNGGRALVFIHGYNTGFDAAVYRMTQIAHDSGLKGTPILFSWASGGRTLDYVYDNNSATAARDSLEKTLKLVVAAGAKRVDIVAHSMGNWVTVETLRQLAIADNSTLNGKLGDVLLASPDIDVDVFKSQMARYGKPRKPFFILTSADDKALRISGRLAGQRPRVGDYGNSDELAALGVVVVDLSAVKGDKLSHTKFAENPVLIKMIGEGLNKDTANNERELTDQVNDIGRNIGGTVGGAAEIVVTTPFRVLKLAVGG